MDAEQKREIRHAAQWKCTQLEALLRSVQREINKPEINLLEIERLTRGIEGKALMIRVDIAVIEDAGVPEG